MKNLVYLAFVLTSAFGQVTVQSVSNPDASQAVQIVQSMIGINAESQTTPCLSPITTCYGVPSGNVVIQPQTLLTQGTEVTWYAVFQTGTWMGTIVETVTDSSGILLVSTVMMAETAFVPVKGYVGPAVLQVTTTATSRSGAIRTLKSSALVEVTN
jgi:hypothetical protein